MSRRNISPPSSGSNKPSKIPAWKQMSMETSDYTYRKQGGNWRVNFSPPLARRGAEYNRWALTRSPVRTNRRQEQAGTSKTTSFQGNPALLLVCPTGLLGGFILPHGRANGNWGPLLYFLPASYIVQNFSCHLLSRWYLARLIPWPWKWKWHVSLKMLLHFQWTTWRYIPQDIILHNHRCENLKSYMKNGWLRTHKNGRSDISHA
jgi:hypothetical protein